MARDWLKSLWPASYKGAKFWVWNDEEEGGRRIVIHQFPMRDEPFLEDLGEDKRSFEVTGYVASDTADSEAATVIATCTTRGAGALVLPSHGAIVVRCLSARRERSKDKHGFIALSLTFVREGFASAIATSEMRANMVFVQADEMAKQVAIQFVRSIIIVPIPIPSPGRVRGENLPQVVIDAVIEAVLDAIAVIEDLRTSEQIEVQVSATQRLVIQKLFDDAPELVVDPVTAGDVVLSMVQILRDLGDGLQPIAGVRAFEAIATDPVLVQPPPHPRYPTRSMQMSVVNTAAVARSLRLAALIAYAEAVVRTPLTDRQAGITLRANVAEYFEAEAAVTPAAEIDLYNAIGDLRDAVIEYLSRVIIDLAPIIPIEANLSMPSLYWAWRLYQNPNRSDEVVVRNRVVHPSVMPLKFEALSK